MRAVRAALTAGLLADTRVSTTIAGSTTSTLKLSSGQGAAWAKGDLLSITGSGAAAANNLACAQVLAVAGDDLSIDPAFPVAPPASVSVKGGAREWLRYLSAAEPGLYYFKRVVDAPVEQLFGSDADSRVVVAHGDPVDEPELFTRVRSTWLLLLLGRDPAWIEGLTQRLQLLFHHRKGSISVAGRDVQELVLQSSELGERGDALFERAVTFQVVTSKVL